MGRFCGLLCERASEGASALSAQKKQIIQLLLLDLRSKKGGGASRGRGNKYCSLLAGLCYSVYVRGLGYIDLDQMLVSTLSELSYRL